jgi:multidrug efflux pump subunit AcrA (membrane-fusion protein)
VLWVVGLVGIALVCVFFLERHEETAKAASGPPKVPVTTAKAHEGNIGVFVDAIGTVTPVYTDSITSQVTGQIVAVHFTEGQLVKQNDPLVDIRARIRRPCPRLRGRWSAIKIFSRRRRWIWIGIARRGLETRSPNKRWMIRKNWCCKTRAPSNSIDQVQAQMRPGAKLAVDAYDRTSETLIETGQLLTLDNQVNTTTGTVRARSVFANQKNELFPSQFVNTRLLVNTLAGVTLIPSSAVQQNGQSSFVYVIQANVAHMRTVKAGVTDDRKALTQVEGIEAGDVVANSSFDKLQDGTEMNIAARGSGGGSGGGAGGDAGGDAGGSAAATAPLGTSENTAP